MTNRNPVYTVSTYSESFGLDMPKDSLVFCLEDNTLWIVMEDSDLSDSLNSVSKQQLNPGIIPVPSGSVTSFAGSSIPSGWLLCNGQAVSRTTYSDLFTTIGTLYGSGDGSTTFNCPDFRGAFLRGSGTHGSQVMANGSAFAGGTLGSYGLDKMQGHWHYLRSDDNTITIGRYQDIAGAGACGRASNGILYSSGRATDFSTDGTNGTPRTGNETNPFHTNINYIIKV